MFSAAAQSAHSSRPRVSPVQPDRCQWSCRGRARSRVALAPSRRDATVGSALDGVLSRRKNRRHRWTGHPHRSGWRGAEDLRNGEQPPACGKRGQPPGVGRRARQCPRARGRGSADAPGADGSPPILRSGPGPGGHARTPPRIRLPALRVFSTRSLARARPAPGGSRRLAPLKL
jgi:hypothetical protein